MKQTFFTLPKLALFGLLMLGLLNSFSAQAQNCRAGYVFSANGAVYLFYDSSYAGSKIVNWAWDFGDGTPVHNTSWGNQVYHRYSQSGTYYVCLTITDTTNCTDTYCDSITVTANNSTCTASFSFTNNGQGNYSFTDQSTGQNLSYYWQFGDGGTSNSANPTHTYPANGQYTVTLQIFNNGGCFDTSFANITVSGLPNNQPCTAEFDSYGGSEGWVYLQPHYKTDSMTSSATFSWSFGDGTGSSNPSASHQYAQSGDYTVCLIITDTANNCTDTYCDTVTVTMNYSLCASIFIPGIADGTHDVKVWLIQHDSAQGTLTAIDSLIAKHYMMRNMDSGYFCFTSVVPGTYYIKAALDTSDSSRHLYMPTYSDTALIWANATAITISGSSSHNNHITLQQGNNPGGPGFIGGLISQGANKKEGDPIENVHVLLLDENNQPVTWTMSDAEGKYSFSNIAYGIYKIWAEIPGKETYPIVVTLSEAKPQSTGNTIVVNSNAVVSGIMQKGTVAASIALYPNPVRETLMLQLQGQRLQWQVIDMHGRVVMESAQAVQQLRQIDVQALPSGLYLLQVRSTEGQWMGRFIKQ